MEAALGLVVLIFLVILVEIVDRLRFLVMSVCVLITAPFAGIGNFDKPYRPPFHERIWSRLRCVKNAVSNFTYSFSILILPCQRCDNATDDRPNESDTCLTCLSQREVSLWELSTIE